MKDDRLTLETAELEGLGSFLEHHFGLPCGALTAESRDRRRKRHGLREDKPIVREIVDSLQKAGARVEYVRADPPSFGRSQCVMTVDALQRALDALKGRGVLVCDDKGRWRADW